MVMGNAHCVSLCAMAGSSPSRQDGAIPAFVAPKGAVNGT